MKKHFMLILLLTACFVSILAAKTFAMNITIGGQFWISKADTWKNHWEEQKFPTISTMTTPFTPFIFPKSVSYAFIAQGPVMFSGPILGFQITREWGITFKGIFNKYEAETEKATDMAMNSASAKLKGTRYNTDIQTHYYFNKYVNIFFGLSADFYKDEKELNIYNIGFARNYTLKYNNEVLQIGPLLGVGVIAYIVKGFYFSFNADFVFYFGSRSLDFTSQKDQWGTKYPEPPVFDKDDNAKFSVFGDNASIAFGYNFFSVGVDISLGLNCQYLYYKYDDGGENNFEIYNNKESLIWALTFSVTYTFSIGKKLKPGEEYKYQDSNDIWVPLQNGKSTNL